MNIKNLHQRPTGTWGPRSEAGIRCAVHRCGNQLSAAGLLADVSSTFLHHGPLCPLEKEASSMP